MAKPAGGRPTCRLKSGERNESNQPSTAEGAASEKEKRKNVRTYPAFNDPSYTRVYTQQVGYTVGTSGKRLTVQVQPITTAVGDLKVVPSHRSSHLRFTTLYSLVRPIGCLRIIWFVVRFFVVYFLYKTNPNPRNTI